MTRLLTLTLLSAAALVCRAEEGVPQPPEFNYGAPLPSPADYNYGAYSPDHYSAGVYPFNANFHHAFGSRQDALDPMSAALLIVSPKIKYFEKAYLSGLKNVAFYLGRIKCRSDDHNWT